MSDGDFSGSYSGTGPVGRVFSVFLAVGCFALAVFVLIDSDGRLWPLGLLFLAGAVFFPLMGWVVEPWAKRKSKRLPWHRR